MNKDIAAQKELRKKWVEALRSGEYKQGRICLCNNNRYCCLGVLCDVAGADFIVYQHSSGVRQYEGFCSQLSTRLMERVGLSTPFGSFGYRKSLIELNDRDKKTFKEIADIIESEPPGLFIET